MKITNPYFDPKMLLVGRRCINNPTTKMVMYTAAESDRLTEEALVVEVDGMANVYQDIF